MTEPKQTRVTCQLAIEDDDALDELLARVDFRQWLMSQNLPDTRMATLGVAVRELAAKWHGLNCRAADTRKDGKQ